MISYYSLEKHLISQNQLLTIIHFINNAFDIINLVHSNVVEVHDKLEFCIRIKFLLIYFKEKYLFLLMK
jgi:hypothetical protein